jgi:serine/threonine protein kinase
MDEKLLLKNEIVLEQLVGEGATGWVYRARRQDSQNLVSQTIALKVFKSQKHLSLFQNEVENLLDLRSPYCVYLFGWECLPQGPAILMEWVDGVSLTEIHQILQAAELKEIERQVFLGLRDLEAHGLCHGDLSPNNILIDKNGHIRLIDFGLSRIKDSEVPHRGDPFGTLQFLSPQRWKGQSPTIDDDFYSLGRILSDITGGLIDKPMSPLFWKERAFREEVEHPLMSSCPHERRIEIEFKNEETIRRLGEKVGRILKTRKLMNPIVKTKIVLSRLFSMEMFYAHLARAVSFVLLLSFSTSESSWIQTGSAVLQVRTHRWIRLSLDLKPVGYSPVILRDLSPGRHRLSWVSATDQGQIEFVLQNGQNLVLGEEHFF